MAPIQKSICARPSPRPLPPGAADYIQDLRQHQVAKAELPLQTVLRLGWGSGSGMV